MAALIATGSAWADDVRQPLFASDGTLHVRIIAPLTTLMRQRSDTEYLDGTFSYIDTSGDEQTLSLKLRARGVYRRQRNTCNLPPIRLNFQKKQVAGTEFAGQDKLKLVTHCNHRRDVYEQYVLKEYLAYRIFNTITDYSFRTRLLKIDYVDSDDGGKTWSKYGFVIEDDDLLAERLGAEVVKVSRIAYEALDRQQAILVSVFQYLIGNTDYSLVASARDDDCCHNTVLLSVADGNYIPVPYDFDFSGLVNARYAKPNANLPIKSVVRRLYRGICLHNDLMDQAIARFKSREASIREAAMTVEGMGESERATVLRYIDGFYEDVADARSVQRRLGRKCLG
jgi:hypothetical protein